MPLSSCSNGIQICFAFIFLTFTHSTWLNWAREKNRIKIIKWIIWLVFHKWTHENWIEMWALISSMKIWCNWFVFFSSRICVKTREIAVLHNVHDSLLPIQRNVPIVQKGKTFANICWCFLWHQKSCVRIYTIAIVWYGMKGSHTCFVGVQRDKI